MLHDHDVATIKNIVQEVLEKGGGSGGSIVVGEGDVVIYDGFDSTAPDYAASANSVRVLHEMLVGVLIDMDLYTALVTDLAEFFPKPPVPVP